MFDHPKLLEVLDDTRFSPEIECYANISQSDLPSGWVIVGDESLLTGGKEIRPENHHVITGLSGLLEVMRVCRTINDHQGEVDVRCGAHVHIDMSGLPDKAVINVLRRYIAYERSIDLVMPPSRRNHHHAQGLIQRLARQNGADYGDGEFKQTTTFLDRINKCKSRSDLSRMFNGDLGCAKFWKVSVNRLNDLGTIEFRQHAGTTDPEKLAHWIVFLAMLRWTTVHFPSTKTPGKSNMDHKARMRKLLKLVMGDWSPETSKFFLERLRFFSRH